MVAGYYGAGGKSSDPDRRLRRGARGLLHALPAARGGVRGRRRRAGAEDAAARRPRLRAGLGHVCRAAGAAAGGEFAEGPDVVDGNMVSATGWPDLAEWSRAFMEVLERAAVTA